MEGERDYRAHCIYLMDRAASEVARIEGDRTSDQRQAQVRLPRWARSHDFPFPSRGEQGRKNGAVTALFASLDAVGRSLFGLADL
jgi:hypothetical protein